LEVLLLFLPVHGKRGAWGEGHAMVCRVCIVECEQMEYLGGGPLGVAGWWWRWRWEVEVEAGGDGALTSKYTCV